MEDFCCLLKVAQFVGKQSIWHRLTLASCLFTFKTNQNRQILIIGKPPCTNSISIQCGTTQQLYISSLSANQIHITTKPFLGNQGFFLRLFFPLSFFSPPASCNARLCNYYATLTKPNAYLMPAYLHTGRRGELKSRRRNPIKCLCGWCDESADGICQVFFKRPGGGAGIILTPWWWSCMMRAACRLVFSFR